MNLFIKPPMFLFLLLGVNVISFSNEITSTNKNIFTVEEQRLISESETINTTVTLIQPRIKEFNQQISNNVSYTTLTQLIIRHGSALWHDTINQAQEKSNFDDRALYWSRLSMINSLKRSKAYQQLLPMQQEKILQQFEYYSRGNNDITFNQKTHKQILVITTDPYITENNIANSHVSGLAGLSFDGLFLSNNGVTAQIETIILPYRFSDVENGILEDLLINIIKAKDIAMIVTLGSAKENFNLPHFAFNTEQTINQMLQSRLPFNTLLKNYGDIAITESSYSFGFNNSTTLIDKNLSRDNVTKTKFNSTIDNELFFRSLAFINKHSPKLTIGHIELPQTDINDIAKRTKVITQLRSMLTLTIGQL